MCRFVFCARWGTGVGGGGGDGGGGGGGGGGDGGGGGGCGVMLDVVLGYDRIDLLLL